MRLGIGIDDMFVILQCWNNLAASGQKSGLSVEERVGIALQGINQWHSYCNLIVNDNDIFSAKLIELCVAKAF